MSSGTALLGLVGAFLLLPYAESLAVNSQRRATAKSIVSVDPLKYGKLVIDTDAGADDAVAILLALGEESLYKQFQLVAITCVNGNTNLDNVVANVLKTLDTAERLDIPVYSGASKAIDITRPSDNYFGEDGFGDFEYPNAPEPNQFLQKKHAVQALIDIVTEFPGEVTVLCIGPLTNIALAIRLDPLFLTKVGQIAIMGGSVEGLGNILPGIEFNFYIDPEAAFIVFNSTDTSTSNIKPIILFPWETVAERYPIPMDWRLNVMGKIDSAKMRLLNKAEKMILNGDTYLSTDGMAAAVTIRPAIVQVKTATYARVQTYGENAGAVFLDYQKSLGRPDNVVVIQKLDVETFKNMLLTNLA